MVFNKWNLDTNSKSVATQINEQNQNWQKLDTISTNMSDFRTQYFTLNIGEKMEINFPNSVHFGILMVRTSNLNKGGFYFLTGYSNGDTGRNNVDALKQEMGINFTYTDSSVIISNDTQINNLHLILTCFYGNYVLNKL